jgi:hypothetical protein
MACDGPNGKSKENSSLICVFGRASHKSPPLITKGALNSNKIEDIEAHEETNGG